MIRVSFQKNIKATPTLLARKLSKQMAHLYHVKNPSKISAAKILSKWGWYFFALDWGSNTVYQFDL